MDNPLYLASFEQIRNLTQILRGYENRKYFSCRSLYIDTIEQLCYLFVMEQQSLADPYLWLEDIDSQDSEKWVIEQNQRTQVHLVSSDEYRHISQSLMKIYSAEDRINLPTKIAGEFIYSFHRDQINIKGLWRRMTWDDYVINKKNWEPILDLDALSHSENENWVWSEAEFLDPDFDRCLIFLSRGGKDARVVREFDLHSKKFVTDGFTLPEAKSDVQWRDRDSVWVCTDFGPESLTESGYPRILKLWQRGSKLSEAQTIFSAEKTDNGIYANTSKKTSILTHVVNRDVHVSYLINQDLTLSKIIIPEDVWIRGVQDKKIFFVLKSDWQSFRKGSIVCLSTENYVSKLVFEPKEKIIVEDLVLTKNLVVVTVLESVKAKLIFLKYQSGQWEELCSREIDSEESEIVFSSDSNEDRCFILNSSFIEPAQILSMELKDSEIKIEKICSSPSRFKSEKMVVEQFFTKSKDGTQIPYFIIRPKDIKYHGKNPTVLYSYGGFEISLLPSYLEGLGKVWIEEKNAVYVVANIRGGNEFGPDWHKAVLKQNRQKAYDDFYSVAEDLIAKNITSKDHLGILGRSNGGLLVGVAMTQRPDLFKAVACQVPLLDMLRYHKLLAGHSWVHEYGNPDDVEEAKYIEKYSPYQNVKPNTKYPEILFMTITTDDRVHPGHARKMMAKMLEMGHKVLFWENKEGGHAGSSNIQQRVQFDALTWTFFTKTLLGNRKK